MMRCSLERAVAHIRNRQHRFYFNVLLLPHTAIVRIWPWWQRQICGLAASALGVPAPQPALARGCIYYTIFHREHRPSPPTRARPHARATRARAPPGARRRRSTS